MFKRILLILGISLMVMLSGCVPNEDMTTQTLNKAGYSNVENLGVDPFGCGEDDTFATRFRATNPNGQVVEGTVCCGILKKCTIRY